MTHSKPLLVYMIMLHLVLGLVLMKSDFLERIERRLGSPPPELSEHYHHMLAYQHRIDRQVPDGAIIFIGDSITQSLAVSNISPSAINFGIGSDTTYGVLQRLNLYSSLDRAEILVLAIGINDLKRREPDEIIHNYERILARLPQTAGILISAIHPVDERIQRGSRNNQRIQRVNRGLKQLAATDSRCHYIDITTRLSDSDGNLKAVYHEGDGLHLSVAGYALWTEALSKAVRELQTQR